MRRVAILFTVLASTLSWGSAPNIYVTPTGGLSGNCPAGINTLAPAQFNNPANWGGGVNQIGPGTTVLVCGTFTFPSGSTGGLIFQGSGSSGSTLTMLFDTGTIIQSPNFAGNPESNCSSGQACGGGIEIPGFNFITINGANTGIIQNTDNGSILGHQASSVGLYARGDHILIKNLTVRNIYVNCPQGSTCTDTAGFQSAGIRVDSLSTNVEICGNISTASHRGISTDTSGGTGGNTIAACTNTQAATGVNIHHNTSADHGWSMSATGSGSPNIYSNTMSDWSNWVYPSGGFYHLDGLITFGDTGIKLTPFIYNNYVSGDMTINGGSPTGFLFCTYGDTGSSSACTIFNNVLQGTGSYATQGQGIYFHGGDGSHSMGPHKVYNNTFIGFATGQIYADSDATIVYDLRNNIYDGNGSQWYFQGNNSLDSNLTSNTNAFFDGRIAPYSWGSANYTTLALWTGSVSPALGCLGNGGTGCDAASVEGDPLLDVNFKPQPGSSAISIGTNLTSLGITALNSDKNGAARSASLAWDAGAVSSADIGLGISPTSLAFGNQAVTTTSSPQTVTLTNNTAFVLNFFAITIIATPADFSISSQTCVVGTPVAIGGSCTVSVVFTPSALGAETGLLQFADDNVGSGGLDQVPLTGTGIALGVGQLSFSPTSLDTGRQTVLTTSTNRTIVATNIGGTNVVVTSITISGDFGETDACGTIAPAATCQIFVNFTPTVTGTRTGTLTVTSNGTGSPQTVSVTGFGCATCNTLFVTNAGNDASTGLSLAQAWRHYPFEVGATGVSAAYTCNPDDLFWLGSLVHAGKFNITSACVGSSGHPVTFATYPPFISPGVYAQMTGFTKTLGSAFAQPGGTFGNCSSPCVDNTVSVDPTVEPFFEQVFVQNGAGQIIRLPPPVVSGLNQVPQSPTAPICYTAASLALAKVAASCPVYVAWQASHTYATSRIPGLGTLVSDSNGNLQWINPQTLGATSCISDSSQPTWATALFQPPVVDTGTGTCEYTYVGPNSGSTVACVVNNVNPCQGATNYLAFNQTAVLSSQVPQSCFVTPGQLRTKNDEVFTMNTLWVKSCAAITGTPARTKVLFSGPAFAPPTSPPVNGMIPGNPYQMSGMKERYGCNTPNQGSWYLDTTVGPPWKFHKATCGTENINTESFYWSSMRAQDPGVMTITGGHDYLFQDIMIGSGDNDMPFPQGRPQTSGQPLTSHSIVITDSARVQIGAAGHSTYVLDINGGGVIVLGNSPNFQSQYAVFSDIGGNALMIGPQASSADCVTGRPGCGATTIPINAVVNQTKVDHPSQLDSTSEGNGILCQDTENCTITNNSVTGTMCGALNLGSPPQLNRLVYVGTMNLTNGLNTWTSSVSLPANVASLSAMVGGTPTTGGVFYIISGGFAGGTSGTFTTNYTGTTGAAVAFFLESPQYYTSATITGNYLRNRMIQTSQMAWCSDFGMIHIAATIPWSATLRQPDVTPPTGWPFPTNSAQYPIVIENNWMGDAGCNYGNTSSPCGSGGIYADQGAFFWGKNNTMVRGGQQLDWSPPPYASSTLGVPIGLYNVQSNSIFVGPGAVQNQTRDRLINGVGNNYSPNAYSRHHNILALDSSLERYFQSQPWLIPCNDEFGTGSDWACTNQFVNDYNIYWDFNRAQVLFWTCTGTPCSQPHQISWNGVPWASGVEDVHSIFRDPGFINPTPGIDNFTPTNLPALLTTGFVPFTAMNSVNVGALLNTTPLPAAPNLYPTTQRIDPNTSYYNIAGSVAPQSNLTGGILTGGTLK